MGAILMTRNIVAETTGAESLAQTYTLLATLLNRCPDVALVQSLRAAGPEIFNAGEAGSGEGITLGLSKLSDFLDQTQTLPAEEVAKQLAIDWTRLFRGVSPNYGPPPPYEGQFRSDLGSDLEVLQQINSLYRDKGATVADDTSNRPDYLGIELSFLAFLCRKAADCYRTSEFSAGKDWMQQAQDFLEQHPSRWVGSYLAPAQGHVKTDFYRGLLCLIEQMTRKDFLK
jgi:TorA maturation chaperone TorD